MKAVALALTLACSLSALALATDAASAPPKKAAPPKRAKPELTAKYVQAVKAWHTRPTGRTAPRDETGRAKLVLASLNTGDRVEIAAATDRGTFLARDLDKAAKALRDSSSASEHPIEPRLIDLLYQLQRKFDAPEVRLVSGYRPGRAASERPPVRGRGSNHSCGRAADIVIPGARDEDVAKAARDLGFVGVGLYPTSGFVHVDVRERSYFWVDRSGPGRKNRERGILADLASKSDARAKTRGEEPTNPFAIGAEVEASLDARTDGEPVHDEDDED